jgi:hypothetical protein
MSNATPRKPQHADTTKTITGTEFAVRRCLVGYPYGQNSAGEATPFFEWHLLLDGRVVDQATKRGPLVAAAREPGAAAAYRA